MSNPLKKLAGQTAVYGLSSIVGRLLNYLLVPLHTYVFVPEQFGIITEMYSYVAFLVVLLMLGMETAYFRFVTKEGYDKQRVFSTIMLTLSLSTTIFVALAFLFDQQVANWLQYPDNSEYVVWFAMIVGFDALSAIPMARLRQEEKPKQFALVNIINILVNIGFNLLFLAYVFPKGQAGEHNWLVDLLYDQDIGVGYVFIANLLASAIKLLILFPMLSKIRLVFSGALLRDMFVYGLPLLLGSLAITINEVLDKPMLKYLLADGHDSIYAQEQVGIYGACAKLAIIMSMFVQAFRYAAEPFFFNKEKEKNAKKLYADVMKYFVIICCGILVGVVLLIDIFKYFISDKAYWVGLEASVILLFAYIFYGIFYNLAAWYKLTGKTRWGLYIPAIGAVVTIVLNLWWIPLYGYIGSAWATVAAYGSMSLISYFIGRKQYPIPYPILRIGAYLIGSLTIVWFLNPTPAILEAIESGAENIPMDWPRIGLNLLVLLGCAALVYVLERPRKKVT